MVKHFTEYDSEILHRMIEVRRSVDSFENKYPTRENIMSILKSGLWAPLDEDTVLSSEELRKFFVISGGSEKLIKVSEIIKDELNCISDKFDNKIYLDILNAPCLIIVAEKKKSPYFKKQSLAFVIENMWLKSVSLNLGFRLLSLFERLNDSESFCEELGVQLGQYVFNGCIIGYPKNKISIGKRPHICEVVKWL